MIIKEYLPKNKNKKTSKLLPASLFFSQDFPIFYTKWQFYKHTLTYKERQLSLPSIHSLPRVPLPNIYFSHTTDLIRQLSHTHMLLPFLNLGTNTTSYYLISRSRVAQCEELWSLNHEVASSNPGCNDFFFLMLWSTQQTFDVSTTSEWRLTLTLDWRWNQVENESFLDVGFWLDWSRPKTNLIPTSLQRRIGRDQKSTWFQRLYNVVCLLG